MLNKCIDAAQEGKLVKNNIINESKFRQIKTILTSILIISGVQGINSSKVLAFEIVPLEAVSTSVSHQYFGLGASYDTFQINVNNYPGLDPMASLREFTLSFAPIGFSPAPPSPEIASLSGGGIDYSGETDTSLKTPLGWQLITIGQIPHYFCSESFFGDPYCATILIPTLTFQAIEPIAGISPGMSLGGFGVGYYAGCGIYCDGLQQSVISVKSVDHAPEPVTILGSAIALGFGITLKRKYSKTHSNNP